MKNQKSEGFTLQGINISHLGKRKIIFKSAFGMGYVSSLEGRFHGLFKKNQVRKFVPNKLRFLEALSCFIRPCEVTRHWFMSPLTMFKVNKIRLAGIRHHFLAKQRGWIHDAAAFMASWNFMVMEGIWQIYDDFARRDAAKASFYEQWKWMNMNLASLGIIGHLTPSVRKSQIESCFSMTLSPLWVAGLEGTCTWSGVFHLHHHPINTHARPSPAEFMNSTIHLKGISGYLGLRIVIFQTTIVVSEIYNQLLMQQESWYYQAKQCTTRSTSIFQKNLPQKITVQILASSLIPPPKKKK